MDYQTILADATNWMFSDITNAMYVIGAIVVIGAVNGIRISLKHCSGSYNGRIL